MRHISSPLFRMCQVTLKYHISCLYVVRKHGIMLYVQWLSWLCDSTIMCCTTREPISFLHSFAVNVHAHINASVTLSLDIAYDTTFWNCACVCDHILE